MAGKPLFFCRDTTPRPLVLPHSTRVTGIAQHMVYQQMLRHDIVPFPSADLDFGVDLLTLYRGNVIRRVQIKGQEAVPANEQALKFSLTRYNKKKGSSQVYDPAALDAFVFVHTELHRYFVVPMAVIRRYKGSITFSPGCNSRWEDAWEVLKERDFV